MLSLTPWRLTWLMRFYPPYFGAGIRIESVSEDFSRIDVAMPMRWYNRNYVGTHFGGSLYSMCDPHLMFILLHQLGRDYVVWDQAASIQFLRPGRGCVRASFTVTPEELQIIVDATADGGPHRPKWTVPVFDDDGTHVADVDKVLYVRRKARA